MKLIDALSYLVGWLVMTAMCLMVAYAFFYDAI
jgi:hypothetical protein